MYCIVVYDINAKRVAKVLKYLRRHMHWIQNSVFEGEVTKAQLRGIKNDLKEIINSQTDSIYFFSVNNKALLIKEVLGEKVGDTQTFI